jgi:hypothetical protein
MLRWISGLVALLLGALGVVKHQRDKANDKADEQTRRIDALHAVQRTERKVAAVQRAEQEEPPHEPTISRPTGNFGADRLRDKP